MKQNQELRVIATITTALVVSWSQGACSDVRLIPVVDAGVDGDGAATGDAPALFTPTQPTPPELPAQPMAPILTPCPDGWREVAPATPDDVTTCSAWPGDEPEECAPDEVHFPGETGCTVIGTPCTASEWFDPMPAAPVVLYVRADPTAVGDGSQANPFGTITEAISNAQVGTLIAVGKGTYDEAISLPTGVTVLGACVDETVISATSGPAQATVTVMGTDTTIRNIQIGGNKTGISVNGSGRAIHLQDVLIQGAQTVGLDLTNNAMATGSSVVIRDTRSDSTGDFGRGIDIRYGAQLQLTRVVLERNHNAGIAAYWWGTSVNISDALIRDTRPEPSTDDYGEGIAIWDYAQITGQRLVITGNYQAGILLSSGASGTFDDLIIRDTSSTFSGAGMGVFGWGISAQNGSSLDIHRILLEDNHEANIYIRDPGTSAALRDVVSHRALPRPSDQRHGNGLGVENDAQASVTRGLFSESHHVGISAQDDATELLLTDVTVRDTSYSPASLAFGEGLLAQDGVHVTILRALFDGNEYMGILAYESETYLDMTDITVRNTKPNNVDGTMGVGLMMLLNARGQLSRGLFEENLSAGVMVAGIDTELSFFDVTVRATQARGFDSDLGRGIFVAGKAHVDGLRAVIEMNREIGIIVDGPESFARLEDIVIARTLPRVFDGALGYGVGAYDDGSLELRRFAITDNEVLGVQVASGGQVKLYDGVVAGHIIGANVQDDEFDISNLQNGVLYTDNTIQFRGSSLPLPGLGISSL